MHGNSAGINPIADEDVRMTAFYEGGVAQQSHLSDVCRRATHNLTLCPIAQRCWFRVEGRQAGPHLFKNCASRTTVHHIGLHRLYDPSPRRIVFCNQHSTLLSPVTRRVSQDEAVILQVGSGVFISGCSLPCDGYRIVKKC